MNLSNAGLLTQALEYLRHLVNQEETTEYSPSQMTTKELKESLKISREDFRNGRYITREELLITYSSALRIVSSTFS